MNRLKTQRGFAAFEILLLVTVLAILGFVVYRAKTVKPLDLDKVAPHPPVTFDPVKKWKSFSTDLGKFSLKHPPEWQEKSCETSADNFSLGLGTSEAATGLCDSEKYWQVSFFSTTAVPTQSEQEFGDDYYKDQTTKMVTVDGVKCQRDTARIKKEIEGSPTFSPIDTLVVIYFCLKPGRSYIATYVQTPTGSYKDDHLETFDTIVQRTWDFK